jgi:hypothetical protein
MHFKTLIDAIELTIQAHAPANTLIKVYRKYDIEPGIKAVPVCVIGSTRSLDTEEVHIPQADSEHRRLWNAKIGVSLLTRSYPLPVRTIEAAGLIDQAQAAVYTAFSENPHLITAIDPDVTLSRVTSIREIVLLNGEYFGYELLLEAWVYE